MMIQNSNDFLPNFLYFFCLISIKFFYLISFSLFSSDSLLLCINYFIIRLTDGSDSKDSRASAPDHTMTLCSPRFSTHQLKERGNILPILL